MVFRTLRKVPPPTVSLSPRYLFEGYLREVRWPDQEFCSLPVLCAGLADAPLALLSVHPYKGHGALHMVEGL